MSNIITFWLPYIYRLILQYLQPEPISFVIPNPLQAETKFTELNDARREYHELPPLPREPVLSDFYTPTDEQHYRELGFIALSMIGIGGVLYYLESYIILQLVI